MLNADPLHFRPTLLAPSRLASAVEELRSKASSTSETWRLLTDHFVVDLDAVAALLPAEEPETVWLAARG